MQFLASTSNICDYLKLAFGCVGFDSNIKFLLTCWQEYSGSKGLNVLFPPPPSSLEILKTIGPHLRYLLGAAIFTGRKMNIYL